MYRALIAVVLLCLAATAWAQPAPILNGNNITVLPTGTTTARAQADRAAERRSVEDYRMSGGTRRTDDATLQAAFSAGGDIYLPAGTYSLCSATPLTASGNLHLRGAGRDVTIIQSCNTAGNAAVTTKNQVLNATATALAPANNITIEDLTFQGNWGAADPQNPGSFLYSETADGALVLIKYATNVVLHNVAVRNSRGFGLQMRFVTNVTIDNFICQNSNRDCIAIWDSQNVRISNGFVQGTEDDAISLHVDSDATLPRVQVSVDNVDFVDSHGIASLGAKFMSFTNLRSWRGHGSLLRLAAPLAGAQGDTARFGVVINNIQILDNIARQWFVDQLTSDVQTAVITIDSIPMSVGTGGNAIAAVPSYVDTSAGTYTSPLGYLYSNSVVQNGLPVPPTDGVHLSNIYIGRSLPAGAAYTAWGYGPAFGGTHGWLSGTVSATNLAGKGIEFRAPLLNVDLSNFDIQSGGFCLRFTNTANQAWVSNMFRNVSIRHGRLSHCPNDGVQFYGQGTTPTVQDITFDDVLFDIDPELASANRGSNGTWVSSGGGTYGVDSPYVGGLQVVRSAFKNVSVPVVETGITTPNYYEANIIRGFPVAANFSASNQGVGTVRSPGPDWWYLIEDSNPTSATYGQALNTIPRQSAAMPNSGRYVAGTFVGNASPALATTGGILGWQRLTTSSNHNSVTALAIGNAGSGGTNGSFSLSFSTSTGTGAAGTCTVSGGVITALSLTSGGSGYVNASATCPSSGLTSAAVTVTTSGDWAAVLASWACGSGQPYLNMLTFQASNGTIPKLTACGTSSNNSVILAPTGTGSVLVTGRLAGNGSAPTLGSCGTSPSLSTGANDVHGTITTGTGTVSNCALTWAQSHANTPDCQVSLVGGGAPPTIAPTTSGLTITTSSTSTKYAYWCPGQ